MSHKFKIIIVEIKRETESLHHLVYGLMGFGLSTMNKVFIFLFPYNFSCYLLVFICFSFFGMDFSTLSVKNLYGKVVGPNAHQPIFIPSPKADTPSKSTLNAAATKHKAVMVEIIGQENIVHEDGGSSKVMRIKKRKSPTFD